MQDECNLASMDGKWFEQRLKDVKVTQEEASAAMGRSRSFMYRVIKGEQELKVSEVMPLAEVLKCRPEEVLKACGLQVSPIEGEETSGAVPNIDEPLLADVIAALLKELANRGVDLARADPMRLGRIIAYLYDTTSSREQAEKHAMDIVAYESRIGFLSQR